jgi:phosphate-selective porin OprO/OprP
MKLRPLALLLPLLMGADHAGAEESWQFKPGGTFQYDWLRVYEDAGDAQFGGMRRARTTVSVKAPGGFDAKAEFDLASNAWTDAYLRWRGAGHSVRIGQYKQPLYLDELNSNRNLLFMEQAMPGSMAIARRLGVGYGYAAGAWRFDVSAHGGDLRGRSKGDGLAARLGFDPVNDGAETRHLGLSLASESPDDETARFRSRAELSGVSGQRLDTGTVSGVDRILRAGVEGLWIRGAWMVKSEYLSARLERDTAPDAQVDGWYVDASWFPTGHKRGYKDGLLEGPALGEGERAVELAARVSRLDLDDAGVRGGDATTLTLGVNWYLNRNVRLMANYVHVDSDRRGLAVEPEGLQARVQVSY